MEKTRYRSRQRALQEGQESVPAMARGGRVISHTRRWIRLIGVGEGVQDASIHVRLPRSPGGIQLRAYRQEILQRHESVIVSVKDQDFRPERRTREARWLEPTMESHGAGNISPCARQIESADPSEAK